VAAVDEAYSEYHPTRAARAVEEFVDDLSNWYVRRNRRRFWKSEHGTDKLAAYQTTHECLITICGLMAPIAPFYSEWMHRALSHAPEDHSVHLDAFPEPDAAFIDLELERRVALARTVASTALAIRNRVNINVRQPLERLLVVTGTGVDEASLERMKGVVLDEVNVRAMEYVSSSSGLVEKSAKPDFKVLGRRMGPLMKSVNQAVRALSTDEIDRFEERGSMRFELPEGDSVEIAIDEVEISSHGIEGWQVEQVNGVTVALDTRITPELKAEGIAREFTNRVQNMRKAAGFNVVDRIAITYSSDDEFSSALTRHADWIRNETLAKELERAESPHGERVDRFEVGSAEVTIGVRRVT
jgi:isoleucyl-tRNA synthetase